MTRTPIVSILVSLYNGEQYLPECLDSILGLDGDIPLEIIVLDDASTDRTTEVMRRYSDSRIAYVRFETNRGAAAAINHGMGLIRGEYVARIDYDDRYHRNFLVDSLAALERFPDAAFVCSNAVMIDPLGQPGGIAGPQDHGEEPGSRDRFRAMLESHFVTASTILGRASHWRRAIPIPEGMNFCDWYMNLTMAETGRVVVLDAVTADYRVHPLGMHATHVKTKAGEQVTWRVLDRFLRQSPRAGELNSYARRIRARHHAEWGDRYFGIGDASDALRCYRCAVIEDPSMIWRGRFLHRAIGAAAGLQNYDRLKAIAYAMRRT